MEDSIEKTWDEIQGKCLSRALDILNDERTLEDDGIDTVDQLVGIAIAIEDLALRLVAQHPLNKLL